MIASEKGAREATGFATPLVERRAHDDRPWRTMRRAAIIAGAIGLLIFCPGAILLISTMSGLNIEDERTALAPLASVPLDSIGEQPLTDITVVIPDTAQWKRIRRKLGAPTFIISAVSSRRLLAFCLADLKIGIEVFEHGSPVRTEMSGAPYAYSAKCERGSLRFKAAPGTELRVAISSLGVRPQLLEQIVVLGFWPDTKDKLVGGALDRELRPIAEGASILGLILIALSILFWRRRGRSQ